MIIIYFIFMAAMYYITQVKGETDEKRCQVETNVKPSDVNNYLQLKVPQTKEGKCYGACVMKSVSIIDSQGKIIPRRVEQVAQDYIKSREQLEKVEAVVKRCSKPANLLSDECNTAYYFMRCVSAMSPLKLAKSGGLAFITPPMISVQLPPVTLVLFQLSVL